MRALQAILNIASLNGVVVSGTITGAFLVWDGRNCVKTVKAHSVRGFPSTRVSIAPEPLVALSWLTLPPQGAITVLFASKGEAGGFVTGTDDGKASGRPHPHGPKGVCTPTDTHTCGCRCRSGTSSWSWATRLTPGLSGPWRAAFRASAGTPRKSASASSSSHLT
jgi:hypothetical protein